VCGTDAESYLGWDYMGNTGVDWGGVGLNIKLNCEETRRQDVGLI
jgi:hypothetical protein